MNWSKGGVVKLLKEAADLLEPDGAWTQGTLETEEGAMCVAGALRKAAGGRYNMSTSAAERVLSGYVRDILKAECYIEGCQCNAGIITYNDNPERTQQEVVDALRTSAKMLEQGEIEVDLW